MVLCIVLSCTRIFPKVADAASADSFQWQITLTRGRIVSVRKNMIDVPVIWPQQ